MNTKHDATGPVLVIAGRQIEDAITRVRRYCGLEWLGHPPETWAYRYYDVVESDQRAVAQVDVLAAGALHLGLSRDDLSYFWNQRTALSAMIAEFPAALTLADADDSTIDRLAQIPEMFDGVTLSLLTKVLHRKRPELIPLINRELIDWYRPVTGERRATSAWLPILHGLRDDLVLNAASLNTAGRALDLELGRHLSHTRLVDIAVWMGSQQ